MENYPQIEPVKIAQNEYTGIFLNSSTDDSGSRDEPQNNPHAVQVSSVDEDENELEEECHHLCEEIEILQTNHHVNLYDRHVFKTTLSSGVIGCRPHNHSLCSFVIEDAILLNSSYAHVVERSLVFSQWQKGTISIKIGSSSTELDRALEIALLDMYVAERSEIILSASNRSRKIRDQAVLPEPCIKCIVVLQSATSSRLTNLNIEEDSSLACLSANEEDKYETALAEKNCGVALFKKQQFVDAFHRFSAGAKILMTLDSFILDGVEINKEISTLYSTLCSNMAECQLKENNPSHAIILCKKSLDHDPRNVKALYRQAVASWSLGDVEQADSLLIKLLEFDSRNLAAKRLHKEVKDKLKSYDDEYSRMMRRIFGNNR